MVNILKDISTVTTIPHATLTKLSDVSELCICHAIEESLLKGGEVTSIFVGIGTLNIKATDGEIKYKFIPSTKFEESVKQTVLTRESPLINKVEEKLKDKVMNVYKELL